MIGMGIFILKLSRHEEFQVKIAKYDLSSSIDTL